ncbi:hypothetical protein J2T17_004456 [Paenibacillus mucilaginosus]|uniref:hypothetical protein n=1 Tax=Paenibacillus mucilaginosus TaxID=61624 RepID=UPI003D1F118F
MGKSCFYGSDTLMEYNATMDNILIAKLMHDAGSPLPGTLVVTACTLYQLEEETYFMHALKSLFGSEIEEDLEAYEERRHLVIHHPELHRLTGEQRAELTKLIEKVGCPIMYDMEMTGKVQESEIQVEIAGPEGYAFGMVRAFIQLKQRLDEMTKGAMI